MKNAKRGIGREQAAELCFLLLLFVFYFMWARIQPLGASPDEQMRYKIPLYIYEHGRLPVGDDPAVRDAVWGISYAFSPYLDYMVAAVFMKLASIVTAQPFALLLAARSVSMLCGVGTAFLTMRIGKRLFPPRSAWLLTVFVALLPGSVFVSTYVNNDAMALFSTALIVYAWLLGTEDGWNYKSCILLAVGVAVCALSYYNAYGFILCSIVLFGSTLLLLCRQRGDYRIFVKKGLLVSLLVLALIAWWFVRNYFLYDGDFLARHASALCAEKYAADGFKPSQLGTPMQAGISLVQMLSHGFKENTISWVELVSRSFVGRFGSLDVCMPTWMENNYLDFIKAGFLLVFIHPVRTFALRGEGKWRIPGILNWCMLAAVVIPNLLNVWYSYSSDYQPQGRYSLPMLVPLGIFLVRGYENLLTEMIPGERTRRIVCAAACALLTAGCVYTYLEVFFPEYAGVSFSIGAFLRGA